MPIEVGVWRLKGSEAQPLKYSRIESEQKLEKVLLGKPCIISEEVLMIGQQIPTAHGKYIDLLGLDIEGNTVIFELKRDRTPREVTAQVLDYASWIQTLSYDDIVEIYEEAHEGLLEEAFVEKFGTELPEELNHSHSMVIVCTELDHGTERIINYLSENYDVPINAVFFRCFEEAGSEFLTRTWLIDPHVTEAKTVVKQSKKKEPWNGRDFVVNFADGKNRSWNDAIQYGFVSAGGGRWFSRTLSQLFVGARVFCMIPKEGYVAVGTVTRESVPLKDAVVTVDSHEVKLLDCQLEENSLTHDLEDMEKCEYVVTVDWTHTVPKEKAFWTKGLRANQNSAFKLRSQYTIEKVEQFFKISTTVPGD